MYKINKKINNVIEGVSDFDHSSYFVQKLGILIKSFNGHDDINSNVFELNVLDYQKSLWNIKNIFPKICCRKIESKDSIKEVPFTNLSTLKWKTDVRNIKKYIYWKKFNIY